MDVLLAPDILPTFNAASFKAKGAVLSSAAQLHTGPLALVELQNGAQPAQCIAGTETSMFLRATTDPATTSSL